MLTYDIIRFWGSIARATDYLCWAGEKQFNNALFARHPALARKRKVA